MTKWINETISGYGKMAKKRPKRINSNEVDEYSKKGYKIYNSYDDAKEDCS